jgi:hypothetical protein
MTDRAKLLIRPPELSSNYTNSHLVANQEELGEENYEFSLRSIFVHTSKGFLTCRKMLRGASGFISPLTEGVLLIFIALKNPSPQPGFNPRTFGQMAGTIIISQPR